MAAARGYCCSAAQLLAGQLARLASVLKSMAGLEPRRLREATLTLMSVQQVLDGLGDRYHGRVRRFRRVEHLYKVDSSSWARRARRQHSLQCTERSGSRRSGPSMACSRASASTTPTSQPMTHLPEPQYYCGALSPLTTTPRRRGVDTLYDRSPSATSPTNGAGSSARRAAQSSACFEGSSQRPSG